MTADVDLTRFAPVFARFREGRVPGLDPTVPAWTLTRLVLDGPRRAWTQGPSRYLQLTGSSAHHPSAQGPTRVGVLRALPWEGPRGLGQRTTVWLQLRGGEAYLRVVGASVLEGASLVAGATTAPLRRLSDRAQVFRPRSLNGGPRDLGRTVRTGTLYLVEDADLWPAFDAGMALTLRLPGGQRLPALDLSPLDPTLGRILARDTRLGAVQDAFEAVVAAYHQEPGQLAPCLRALLAPAWHRHLLPAQALWLQALCGEIAEQGRIAWRRWGLHQVEVDHPLVELERLAPSL